MSGMLLAFSTTCTRYSLSTGGKLDLLGDQASPGPHGLGQSTPNPPNKAPDNKRKHSGGTMAEFPFQKLWLMSNLIALGNLMLTCALLMVKKVIQAYSLANYPSQGQTKVILDQSLAKQVTIRLQAPPQGYSSCNLPPGWPKKLIAVILAPFLDICL